MATLSPAHPEGRDAGVGESNEWAVPTCRGHTGLQAGVLGAGWVSTVTPAPVHGALWRVTPRSPLAACWRSS